MKLTAFAHTMLQPPLLATLPPATLPLFCYILHSSTAITFLTSLLYVSRTVELLHNYEECCDEKN
ncbi:hypothetical protein A2U01_0014841 [Trifolium medium]|uniref:Uncharacterized protein n=1 Tax=Trifolium medium TaxID=97028 RepID=A0A392N241_9FABA|nr:hypothetical protein [Trifolium medium]